MYKVHGYMDDRLVINWQMAHIPRVGDIVRFAGNKFARVVEVVWCMDEESIEGQRINIQMKTDAD